MKYKVIDAAEAPGRAKPVNRRRQIVSELLQSLGPETVAQVTPDKEESIRGLKSTLTRAGNRDDRKVRVWDVDGKVYVRLAD